MDYSHYLELLALYSRRHKLDIWAYCLMPNHVHIVGVPHEADSLANVFRTVHMMYSQYFNHKAKAVGHLWQGRFHSCALDERHLYAAVRYVEQNPVRCGLSASAYEYPWSSARSHIDGVSDKVLTGLSTLDATVQNWGDFLMEPPDAEAQNNIFKATQTGRPCGAKDFVSDIETRLGRTFALRSPGRPHKNEGQSPNNSKEQGSVPRIMNGDDDAN
jgi:putative transposase